MKKTTNQNHPRFTDEELSFVKDVFADNQELIKVCYRVFFQLPLSDEEKKVISKTFKNESLYSIFDKLFCPRLENEQTFLGIDDWYDLQFADKPLAEAMLLIKAREWAVNYIKQQVDVLFGGQDEELKFSSLTNTQESDEKRIINLLARKEIINKVRTLFGTLQVWAGAKTESKEDMMKRLFSSSNK